MDLGLSPPRPDEGSESENGDLHHFQRTLGDSMTSRPHLLVDGEDEKIMGKYGSNAGGGNEDGSGNEAVLTASDTSKAATPDADATLKSTTNGHARPLKSGSASSDTAPAPEANVPFAMVTGEVVSRIATTADSGKLFLTNFRLHHCSLLNQDVLINVPLGLIELAELRDPLVLTLYCKNGRLYHIPFEDLAKAGDTAEDWLKQVSEATTATDKVQDVFAFAHGAGPKALECSSFIIKQGHHQQGQARAPDGLSGLSMNLNSSYAFMLTTTDSDHAGDIMSESGDAVCSLAKSALGTGKSTSWFQSEVERLGFDLQVSWRVTQVNVSHKLCPTYPEEILVPHSVSDPDLVKAASFRWSRRIPSVVFRHVRTGAVLARCSQPEVGILGWRSKEDEKVIRAIYDACASSSAAAADSSASATNGSGDDSESNSISNGCDNIKDLSAEAGYMRKVPKVLMVDARSYAAAVGNRARGGGVECEEYYENTEVVFMNLANIHSIRKSFQALRALLNSPSDQAGGNWFQSLDSTKWLSHLSSLLKASVRCAKALDVEGRPVIVHCSDGWDRTPQIVSITQILLDPYYRTIEGFQVLIEKDWLDYGHKMADRCGNAIAVPDPNERSPIFLQWLDCVHQLVRQFPCNFEFNATYLVKLATHVYSQLFGTFLCNSQLERKSANICEKTTSVFDFLRSNPGKFRNYLHSGGRDDDVLWPKCDLSNLLVWKEVYLSSRSPKVPPMFSPPCNGNENQTAKSEPASHPNSNSASGRASSTSSSAPVSDSEDVDGIPRKGKLLPSLQPDVSANSSQKSSSFNCDQVLVNGTVKEIKIKSAIADKWHPREEDGGYNRGQEVIQGLTLQPVLNRPLLAANGVESSTDTLVPETDVEERRKRYCSALRQEQHLDRCHAQTQDMQQPQISAKQLPVHSVSTMSTRGLKEGNNSTTLGEDTEGRQSMMFAHLDVPYDSDGLLTISDPVQETLSSLIKAHREEVVALRKELCITRRRLIRRSSEGPATGLTNAGAHTSSGRRYNERPSSCAGDREAKAYCVKSSKTNAASVASSWENVDESDVNAVTWSAPIDSLSTMNCQRCQTSIWAGKRKYSCHHCARFFCRDCFELFFLVSSSSTATSSSNEETANGGDGVGVGNNIGESDGEATFVVPRGFKVCGECFRELNSDVEKESSKEDNEEEEYLGAELELFCGGKIILTADSTDASHTTTTLDEEALEVKEEDNLDSE